MEDPEPPEDEPTAFRLMRRIEYTGRIHHMAFRSVLQEGGLPAGTGQRPPNHHPHPGHESA